MAAHPYKGVRIPQDLLDQVQFSADRQGVSFSDWLRQAVLMRLYSESNGDPGLAYAAARSLVMPMVKQVLHRLCDGAFVNLQQTADQLVAELPATYEEAMMRYGFVVEPIDPSHHGG